MGKWLALMLPVIIGSVTALILGLTAARRSRLDDRDAGQG